MYYSTFIIRPHSNVGDPSQAPPMKRTGTRRPLRKQFYFWPAMKLLILLAPISLLMEGCQHEQHATHNDQFLSFPRSLLEISHGGTEARPRNTNKWRGWTKCGYTMNDVLTLTHICFVFNAGDGVVGTFDGK